MNTTPYFKQIHLGSLPQNVTPSEMADLIYSKCKRVESVKTYLGNKNHYTIVVFYCHKDAVKALKTFN